MVLSCQCPFEPPQLKAGFQNKNQRSAAQKSANLKKTVVDHKWTCNKTNAFIVSGSCGGNVNRIIGKKTQKNA